MTHKGEDSDNECEECAKAGVNVRDMRTYTHPTSTAALLDITRIGFRFDEETQSYQRESLAYVATHDPAQARQIVHALSACAAEASEHGIILHLLDSGAQIALTPYPFHMFAPTHTDLVIHGVGKSKAEEQSPMVCAYLDIEAKYVVLQWARGYLCKSISFPLFPTGRAEDQNWEFVLNNMAPRMITDTGRIIPTVRDKLTGYHWVVERTHALPALEKKASMIQQLRDAQYPFSRKQGQIPLKAAEKKPDVPDTQYYLDQQLKFGGRQNTLLVNREAPDKEKCPIVKFLLHAKPATRCHSEDCQNAKRNGSDFCSDRCCELWENKREANVVTRSQVKETVQSPDLKGQAQDKNTAAEGVTPPAAGDTPENDGEKTATEDTGGSTEAVKETDEQVFKGKDIEHLKNAARRGKVIQAKLPHVRLMDTGSKEQIQKVKSQLHRIYGHLSDRTLKSASKMVEGLELLDILEATGATLPHCDVCAQNTSLPPIPRGKPGKIVRRSPHRIIFIDMSGQIEEKSIHNNFAYWILGVTEDQWIYAYGMRYRNQALFLISRMFADGGGAPSAVQIDPAGEFTATIADEYFKSKQVSVRKTDAGHHYQHGMVERRNRSVEIGVRNLLYDSGLSPKYWYYALKHYVLLLNLLTESKEYDSDKGTGMTIWEKHFGEKPNVNQIIIGGFGCLAYLILSEEQRNARGLSGFWGIRSIPGVYLGCWVNPTTQHLTHLITDGFTIFTSRTRIKVVPDVMPLNMGVAPEVNSMSAWQAQDEANNYMLTGRISQGGFREYIAETIRQEARDVKLANKEDEDDKSNRKGKKKQGSERRPFGAPTEEEEMRMRPSRRICYDQLKPPVNMSRDSMLRFVKVDRNAEVHFDRPNDFDINPAPVDMNVMEPYTDAKYGIAIPVNFETEVDRKVEHPHKRFLKRAVRKEFEVKCDGKVAIKKAFRGTVTSYSADRALFRIDFEDNDWEEWDFEELRMNIVMDVKYGDRKDDHGLTRNEKIAERQSRAMLAAYEEELFQQLAPSDLKLFGKESDDEARSRVTNARAFAAAVTKGTAIVAGQEVIYDDEPRNFKEVKEHPEVVAILEAAGIEIQQMRDMDIGVFASKGDVDEFLRSGGKVLNTKMVYKRKYEIDENGVERFKKWKGRLSVVGTGELGGIDAPYKVFSPTIGFTAIRTMISMTCGAEYDTKSFDLSGAFLRSDLLDRCVYIKLPDDCGKDAGRYLRLTKSVYGLRTSNSDFNKQFVKTILGFEKVSKTKTDTIEVERKGADGKTVLVNKEVPRVYRFKQLKMDQCIFAYEDDDGNKMILGHYIDDLIISVTNPELRNEFLDHLRSKWDVTDEGTLTRFLGTHFVRDRKGQKWVMSMQSYIERIAKRFNLQDAPPKKTPMDANFKLTEEDLTETATEEMISLYRSMIGSIGYACVALRYDCLYAFSVLSKYLAKPCKKTIEAAKRVIQYMLATKDFEIEWSISDADMQEGTANVLFGAVDASYAMDEQTRRSHMGFINFVNHGPVSWASKLQPIVTLSSAEAEYVALASEVQEVKYLRQLMEELGSRQVDSTLIYEDNRACILIAANESSSAGRCKHIHVKFRFTAEAIQRKEIKIQYIPSKLNYADIFTKALTEAAFKSCLDLCRNRKSPSSRDLLIPDAAEVTEINHETFLVMTVERTENW